MYISECVSVAWISYMSATGFLTWLSRRQSVSSARCWVWQSTLVIPLIMSSNCVHLRGHLNLKINSPVYAVGQGRWISLIGHSSDARIQMNCSNYFFFVLCRYRLFAIALWSLAAWENKYAVIKFSRWSQWIEILFNYSVIPDYKCYRN